MISVFLRLIHLNSVFARGSVFGSPWQSIPQSPSPSVFARGSVFGSPWQSRSPFPVRLCDPDPVPSLSFRVPFLSVFARMRLRIRGNPVLCSLSVCASPVCGTACPAHAGVAIQSSIPSLFPVCLCDPDPVPSLSPVPRLSLRGCVFASVAIQSPFPRSYEVIRNDMETLLIPGLLRPPRPRKDGRVWIASVEDSFAKTDFDVLRSYSLPFCLPFPVCLPARNATA